MAITTAQPSEVIFQEFTTSGMWHIPTNAIEATVEIVGGGGGGGSGDWRTSTSASPTPGFGGLGAQGIFMTLPITDRFPASVPVFVGQGGAGGQASVGSDGVKNNGANGTSSSIGFLYAGRNALQYEVPRIFAMGGIGGGQAALVNQFIYTGPTLENFAYSAAQHWKVFPIYQISGSTVNFNATDGNPLEWASTTPVRLYVFVEGAGSFGGQIYNITWTSYNTGTITGSPGGTVNNVYGVIIPTTQGYGFSTHSDGSSYPGNASSVGGGGGGSGGYWASSGATNVPAQSGGLRYGYEGGTYRPLRHPAIVPSVNGGIMVTGQGVTTIGSAGIGGSAGIPTPGANGEYGSGGGGGGGSTKGSGGYAGARGGNGGFPGGGGGGGGVGYTAGNPSGAGGNGANGRVRIWTRTRGR